MANAFRYGLVVLVAGLAACSNPQSEEITIIEPVPAPYVD